MEVRQSLFALGLSFSALLPLACGDTSTDGPGEWTGNGDGEDGTPARDGTPAGDGDGQTPRDGTPGDGDGASGDGDGAPGDGDGGDGSSGEVVRFVVLGDGGTGDDNQKKVAAVVRDICAQKGCDFALYLGDNLYDKGAETAADSIFQTHFEDIYAELNFPFHVALGNHDYGGLYREGIVTLPFYGTNSDGEVIEAKAQAQINYSMNSEKWVMPAAYYTFQVGPVAFFALDTNSLVLQEPLLRQLSEQQAWFDAEVARSTAPWKVVFGHHPYISNGEHGNTGTYRAILPVLGDIEDAKSNGLGLKTLVEESVCGNVQLYFSGHDHDREWLDSCGTSFIVSGAAAKLDPIAGRGNDFRWQDGTKHGFMWAEIDGDVFTGAFYDEDGALNYEDVVMR